MSTKTTKAPSELEQATARRDEIRAALEEVRAFRTESQATVERIDADRAAGKLGTDYAGRTAAVQHVADAEDQEGHLLDLLTVAEQSVESFALADALGGLSDQREALAGKRAQTVESIRANLADYAEAVRAYNSELTGHIGAARRAGLIEGQADPTLPVLMGGGEHGHPRRLVAHGEHFTTVHADTDSIIREARR